MGAAVTPRCSVTTVPQKAAKVEMPSLAVVEMAVTRPWLPIEVTLAEDLADAGVFTRAEKVVTRTSFRIMPRWRTASQWDRATPTSRSMAKSSHWREAGKMEMKAVGEETPIPLAVIHLSPVVREERPHKAMVVEGEEGKPLYLVRLHNSSVCGGDQLICDGPTTSRSLSQDAAAMAPTRPNTKRDG